MRIEIAMTHVASPMEASTTLVFNDDVFGPGMFERKPFLEALYEDLGMDVQELVDSEWESPIELMVWVPVNSGDEEGRAAFVVRYHERGTALTMAGIAEFL